jgi:hypothetical protein
MFKFHRKICNSTLISLILAIYESYYFLFRTKYIFFFISTREIRAKTPILFYHCYYFVTSVIYDVTEETGVEVTLQAYIPGTLHYSLDQKVEVKISLCLSN